MDDVAALTERCLLHRSTGVLNVATGISKSFLDVANLVVRQFNRRIEIATAPRQRPVTHRHHDVTNLIKAFPNFRFIALEQGIERVHQEAAEKA